MNGISKLLVALLFTSQALHAGLPAQAQVLAVEFIKNPALRFKEDITRPGEDPETVFARLRAIYAAAGEEAVAPLVGKDMPTLEEELALIGRALTKEPEKAKELRDWYGCHWASVDHALVESYYLSEEDKKAGKTLEKRKMPRNSPRYMFYQEPPHKEHSTEAYRLFWEAWWMVGINTAVGAQVNACMPNNVVENAGNKSLSILQYYLESYIRECPSTDETRIGEHVLPTVRTKLQWVFKALGRIGTRESVECLLACHDKMISAGFTYNDRSMGEFGLRWSSSTMSIRQLVWMALTDPEDNVAGRNKPVIEAALKQEDLKPEHRALLEEALKIIREREAKGP